MNSRSNSPETDSSPILDEVRDRRLSSSSLGSNKIVPHHHIPEGATVRSRSIASIAELTVGRTFTCCGLSLSGNALSLLVSAILFAVIAGVQYYFGAVIAHSLALKADCISMGVDSLSFMGSLFAECSPFPDQKRKIELTMSGVSLCLLLGFTVSFILEAIEDVQASDDDGDGVNGYIVMGFALGGLVFDVTSLCVYRYFGYEPDAQEEEGQVVFGISMNMCAALLHVLSDLARSTTTLIESIIILEVHSVSSTRADGISALIVCSTIAIGATIAFIHWCREVYEFVMIPEETFEQFYKTSAELRISDECSLDDVPIISDPYTHYKDGAHHKEHHHHESISGRTSSIADGLELALEKKYRCCCCEMSGNALSLLVSAILFAVITGVQYYFGAVIAHSLALKADCISMGVDSLSFMGSLFAECSPFPDQKRKIELTMSGVSLCLLLGFTVSFILEAIEDVQASDDDGDGVNGYIVMGFALGGLAFDLTSLCVYRYFGYEPDAQEEEGQVVFGISMNMCAALLHVLSDLARSTTTLIESIIILEVHSVSSTRADGISALIVCSTIAIGATIALIQWCREVHSFFMGKHHDHSRSSLEKLSENPYLLSTDKPFFDGTHYIEPQIRRRKDEKSQDTYNPITLTQHLD